MRVHPDIGDWESLSYVEKEQTYKTLLGKISE